MAEQIIKMASGKQAPQDAKEFWGEFGSMKRVVKAVENYVAARRAYFAATTGICEADLRQEKAYEVMQARVTEHQKAFGHPADKTDQTDPADGRAA